MSKTMSEPLRVCASRLSEYLDHRIGCDARRAFEREDECTCGLTPLLDQPLPDASNFPIASMVVPQVSDSEPAPPAQYFDPLATMVGEFARDFVAPEARMEAIDRLYMLLNEARRGAGRSSDPTEDGCECHGGTEVASCEHCVEIWARCSSDPTEETICDECGKAMDDTEIRILDKNCLHRLRRSSDPEPAPPARQHGPNDGCGELLWEHMGAEPGFDEEIRQAKAEIAEGRGVPFSAAPQPLDVERLAQALGPHPQDPELRRAKAERIAAEYARLSPTPEEGAENG